MKSKSLGQVRSVNAGEVQLTDQTAITVVIMAGGTGGHIFPGLAVAEALQQCQVNVEWLGAAQGMETKLVPKSGIKIHVVDVVSVRGKQLVGRLKASVNLVKAVMQAIKVLRSVKPDCVIGMGGFAAGPGAIAATLLRIPVVIHEQNAIAGVTNKILAKVAKVVFTGFPGVFPGLKKAVYVGNPVRADIVQPRVEQTQDSHAVRILVVGGSRGALALNQVMPAALAKLKLPYDVWHQTGEATIAETNDAYRMANVTGRVDPFIDDMAAAYEWADIVVCRAGALTVAELTAAGVAAILVPYPYAVDDHQTANANLLADAGAGVILQQEVLSAENLANEIMKMVYKKKYRSMGAAARELFVADSAKKIAEHCLQLIGRSVAQLTPQTPTS